MLDHLLADLNMSSPNPETPANPSTNTSSTHPAQNPADAWYSHSSAQRINTDALLYQTISQAHPTSTVTIIPQFNAPLKAYLTATATTSSKDITITPTSGSSTLSWLLYAPPLRRLSGDTGTLGLQTQYESYLIRDTSSQQAEEFLVYVIDGRDGTSAYNGTHNQYVVHSPTATAQTQLHDLVKRAGSWSSSLHDEIWVYDQYWRKSSSLYHSIQNASWANVILHQNFKTELQSSVTSFFDSRARYARLNVPWKRGIILYGPPGNGKTISIKATMHMLYARNPPIPTLYVKTLTSYGGPEYSVNEIFKKARAQAPCYLVFEDLDSLLTEGVRSFFLNAVDGLAENEGVLMVGSTNYLERLDPGIVKRPSRFDRKYEFGNPDGALRVRYAEFWRGKILGRQKGSAVVKGDDGEGDREAGDADVIADTFRNLKLGGDDDDDDITIEFPKILCKKIAAITDGFSFAYMQEAFVSALLRIATREHSKPGDGHSGAPRNSHDDEKEEDVEEDEWELVGGLCNEEDGGGEDGDDDALDKYILWRELKVQIAELRKELGNKEDDA
jgi:transitional endoplasmic reticulum ATPase